MALPPEELCYLREFLAKDEHWVRLVGGPKRGDVLTMAKNRHEITIAHLVHPMVFGSASPTYVKLRYIRNPVVRTEFVYVE